MISKLKLSGEEISLKMQALTNLLEYATQGKILATFIENELNDAGLQHLNDRLNDEIQMIAVALVENEINKIDALPENLIWKLP